MWVESGVKPFMEAGQKLDMESLLATWSYIFQGELGAHATQEVDARRIEDAFCSAARKIKRWPTPAEVIEIMAPRPQHHAIPYLPQRTSRGYEELKKIQQMLSM